MKIEVRLIVCNSCGGVVTWQLQKGRYYGSCQRKNDGCRGQKLLREDYVETMVTDVLKTLVCPAPEVISWLSDTLRERHKESIESNEKQTAAIEAQITHINRMLEGLYDDKLAGEISIDKYKEKQAELAVQKVDYENQLRKIDKMSGKRLG